jgi:rod shape-determining protein MreD
MRWLTYFILAYLALGLQVGLRGFVEVRGATPNFVLMIVVFLAINGRREPVLIACFLLGLMQDLFTQQPMGTWAIAYSLVGASVYSTQEIVYPKHPLTHFCLTLLGGILAGVVLTIHGWIYPLIHGRESGGVGATGDIGVYLASALYSAVLAPLFLGVLHRLRKAFAFSRRRA